MRVYETACSAPAHLTPEVLAQALTGRFGFPVPVATRTLSELSSTIAANPFGGAGALHVVFFDSPPAAATVEALEAKRAGEERVAALGRELFLDLPHGTGRSKLALGCTAPGVPGNPTMRNWKTVLQLRSMLAG